MTPRTDLTARRLTAIEKQIDDCTEDVARKHQENRTDIHQIRNDHQSIANALHAVQTGIASLVTKLDTLYGTDGGRPGQVDELKRTVDDLKRTIAENREAVKREMDATESRIGVKIDAVRTEMKSDADSMKKEFAALGKEVGKELRGYALKFMFVYGAFIAIVWVFYHADLVMRLLGGK